jgi:glyoxylase-like metal-dependent hydrolase (beta-lactamase superfamily II)
VIHTLRLRMSNVHLALAPRPVLIDTGSPGDAERILRWIAALGVGVPDTFILTHAHADHAGSAAELRRLTGARLCLAPEDWPMAAAGRNGPLGPVRLTAWPLQFPVPDRFDPFTPDVALDGQAALEALGVDATLMATPGHTPGSVSLLFRDGQAVVGDLLMGGYLGGQIRPRHPRPHYFARSTTQNAESLARVLSRGAQRLHVGHGGPLAVQDIQGRSH